MEAEVFRLLTESAIARGDDDGRAIDFPRASIVALQRMRDVDWNCSGWSGGGSSAEGVGVADLQLGKTRGWSEMKVAISIRSLGLAFHLSGVVEIDIPSSWQYHVEENSISIQRPESSDLLVHAHVPSSKFLEDLDRPTLVVQINSYVRLSH